MGYDADTFAGSARLRVGGHDFRVRVRLSGRFEPVDGRYHWGGRVEPRPDLVVLLRSGARDGTLAVGHHPPRPVRLVEADVWGGVKLAGTGRPPWSTVDS